MAEISKQHSSYGRSADITERAVAMHEGREGEGNALKEDFGPAFEGHCRSQEGSSKPAAFPKQICKAQIGNLAKLESSSTPNRPAEITALQKDLTREAALRCLNGTSSPHRDKYNTVEPGSSTSAQPVLVSTYPNSVADSRSSNHAKMKRNRTSRVESKSFDLPPLERFSFQDILASIDPEIRLSIDSIAEICGRSKMSLADEYNSHLPPQGELVSPHEQQDGTNALPAHLATVPESSPQDSGHSYGNSTSLALVGISSQRKAAIVSAPTAATSVINSHAYTESFAHYPINYNLQTNPHSAMVPQVHIWMPRSNASFTEVVERNQTERDPTVALQRILTKLKETS